MNLLIIGVLLYSILCIFLSFYLEGFNGLKFLISWTILSMISLIIFFVYIYKDKTLNLKNIEKKHKKFVFFGMIFVLLCSGLFSKLIILSFDVDEKYEKSQLFNGRIIGFKTLGNGKKSGGTWAIVEVFPSKENDLNRYLIVCNLNILQKCNYGKYKDRIVIIKGFLGDSYPLRNKMVIYQIRSEDGNININSNQQIKIYKDNKLYLSIFIFFILFPSCYMALVIPKKIANYGL